MAAVVMTRPFGWSAPVLRRMQPILRNYAPGNTPTLAPEFAAQAWNLPLPAGWCPQMPARRGFAAGGAKV
jgi:hypothetical protein